MNGISFLSQGIFCGLDRLKNLNLNANRIRYIMPGVFQNMPNLEQLYLDQNRIRHLPGNMFYGLSKLKQLTLADNQIRNIDQGALNGLVHIDHIDLQRVDTRGWTLHVVRIEISGKLFHNGSKLQLNTKSHFSSFSGDFSAKPPFFLAFSPFRDCNSRRCFRSLKNSPDFLPHSIFLSHFYTFSFHHSYHASHPEATKLATAKNARTGS